MLGQENTASYVVSAKDKENDILYIEITRAGKEGAPEFATFHLEGNNLVLTTDVGGSINPLVLSRIDRATFEERLTHDEAEPPPVS